MSLSAMDVVKMFEEDAVTRKRLAELLVGEPDVRLAIISAVLRDVATKSDIEKLRGEFKSNIERLKEEFRGEIDKLRSEFKSDIERLEQCVGKLEERMSGFGKRFDMMYKSMLAFNTPTLAAVIEILLKMVLAP